MEYYSKCNVCGKISCYTDNDIKENNRQSLVAGLSALSSVTNAAIGTRYDMYESNKMANMARSRIVDYSKCPNCGSKDTLLVTKKFAKYSNKMNNSYTIDDLIKEAKGYLKKEDFKNAFCFAAIALNEEENDYDAYLIKFLSSYEVKSLKDLDTIIIDYSNNQHFKNLLRVSNSNQKSKLLLQCKKKKQEYIKYKSLDLLKKDNKKELITNIDYHIKKLEDYNDKDSKKICKELNDKKNIILYELGCNLMEKDNINSITKAIEIFNMIDDYKDSNNQMKKCNGLLNEKKKKQKRNIIITAISIIIVIILINICDKKNYGYNYDSTVELFDSGNYYEVFHDCYSRLKSNNQRKINDRTINMISKHKWKSKDKLNYTNMGPDKVTCLGNEFVEINNYNINHYIICDNDNNHHDYGEEEKINVYIDLVEDDKVIIRLSNRDLYLYVKKDNKLFISRKYTYSGESKVRYLEFE